ncbi:TolC family protein [Hyphomicrobium sp. 2TAF46]|uniref:TolC family protein n=1 Tax=Hyphomicrobium sp. 2TAF46 TaxID=3233019 RepID=UPI003F92C711
MKRATAIRAGKNGVFRPMFAAMMTSLALGGCAQFSADGGMLAVQDQTGGVLSQDVVKIRNEDDAAQAQARVKALLGKTLTADSAVQIALLNNRGLQSAYNELGVSEAQMVEASLPPSPTISLAALAGTGIELERQIVSNVLALLTLRDRSEIAQDRFRAAQSRAVEATLKTSADARRAYYRAVASAQIVSFLEEARVSAESVSELAKKLGETGALPKVEQAREHAFYAEVSGQLALSRLKQRSEREKLNRALGLWGDQTKYRLPASLMKLPATPKPGTDIEARTVTSRADLEAARIELAALAKQYGLTQATRYIDVLNVSSLGRYERKYITDVSYSLNAGPPPTLVKTEAPAKEITHRHGIDVEFQIPIYDFGEARMRLAEETYLQAVNRLIEKAVNARSEAREAYTAYRGSYDIAKYYDKEILPLREFISQQELLAYNGMLSDLFSLLADARARIAANVQAIEAKRDFWLASVDLQTAVSGGGSDMAAAPSAAMTGAGGG